MNLQASTEKIIEIGHNLIKKLESKKNKLLTDNKDLMIHIDEVITIINRHCIEKQLQEQKSLELMKRAQTITATSEREFALQKQNDDISRIVKFFDMERKKLQPNFVRKEYRNMDGEYLLRIHLKETGRTPQMFADAIRWLFSANPKAEFHRQYIMNIGKLIEHFNTLEHQAMYAKEAIEFNEKAQAWASVLRKRGMSEEQIIEELKKGGYIK